MTALSKQNEDQGKINNVKKDILKLDKFLGILDNMAKIKERKSNEKNRDIPTN